MKRLKLNNKGLTAVEILVSFILMVIIVVSMYTTVNSYKNRQSIESDKDKIVAYKNLLTKEIQDDLIKKGLVDAKINDSTTLNTGTRKYYEITLTFRDGSKKVLRVNAVYARDFGDCLDSTEAYCLNDQDDILEISYGTDGGDDYTTYKLPDLGYGYNGNNVATDSSKCTGGNQGCKVYDFRINNVIIDTDNSIFSFYVGFYHPDLGTRYGIDIVCPINYF
ncbi:MAG: hypothetical protein PUC82_00385 [bacterium]|nr:hypothetical protein [bacterium]